MIITKIDFQNKDLLSGNYYCKTNRKSKVGVMLTALTLSAAISVSACSSINGNDTEVIDPYVAPFSATISTEEINDMSVILNDNDCGNTFFADVVDILKDDGLRVTTAKGCDGIINDNCTIITLDQQYSAGESTLIFAPYNNTRLGHSDSLAIAMRSAFDQNGFLVSDILTSQIGYEVDGEGNVTSSVPTDTERAIADDKDVSFVTISFGTQTNNAKWVAKSIENGLARQKYYLDNYDSQTDLIYRASASDSIDTVAEYFGADKSNLKTYNKFTSDDFNDSQTVVNPAVGNYDAFNRDSEFYIDGNKTKAY